MKTLLLRASLVASLVASLGAAACTDSVAPSARVQSATPDQLVPSDDALDDLAIIVAYDDGDGDLGGGTAEVHDCRADGLRIILPIPDIAPDAVIGKPISGTLELHVNDVGAIAAGAAPDVCRDLGVADVGVGNAVFCVVLVDAAGHEGEGDCTRAIGLTTD